MGHLRRYGRRRGARENPVSFMDTMAVIASGAAGFFVASLADRFIATHALLTIGGNPADGPPVGSVYNTEAVTAPLWSNWKRMLGAALAIGVPLGISAKGPSAWKTTMRGVAIGAAVRTVGKSLDDLSAKLMGTGPMGERLFAQEIKSQNGVLNAAATAPNALPIGSGGNGQGVHILQSSGTAAAGAVPAATRSAGTGGMLNVFRAQHGPGVGAPAMGHHAPRQFNPPPPPASVQVSQPQTQVANPPPGNPRDITRPIQQKHANGLSGLASMAVPKLESSDEAAE